MLAFKKSTTSSKGCSNTKIALLLVILSLAIIPTHCGPSGSTSTGQNQVTQGGYQDPGDPTKRVPGLRDISYAESMAFRDWCTKYNKQEYYYSFNPRFNDYYTYLLRQTIFVLNLRKINQFNSNTTNTFKESVNRFSAMTQSEFEAQYLNYTPQQERLLSDIETATEEEQGKRNLQSAYPASFDVRESIKSKYVVDDTHDIPLRDRILSPRNQGDCGSCWSFAVAKLAELSLAQSAASTSQFEEFSEQQILDCVNPAFGYSSNGCSGGQIYQAMNFTVEHGLHRRQDYFIPGSRYIVGQFPSYVGEPDPNNRCDKSIMKMPGSDRPRLPAYQPPSYSSASGTVDNLKRAISSKGAVAVAIRSQGSSFRDYSSGIFNQCASTSEPLDHAVLVVGYTEDYWIILNSWGTDWGDEGYMKLAIVNTCGVSNTRAYYFN